MNRSTKIIMSVVVALLLVVGVSIYAIWPKQPMTHTASMNTNSTNNSSSSTSVSDPSQSNTSPTSDECRANELSLSTMPDPNGAAAGSQFVDLILKNTGSRNCTLVGYPGVSLTDELGAQIGSPADRSQSQLTQKIALTPQSSAYAVLKFPNIANFPSSTCQSGATQLKVYPPNSKESLTTSISQTSWCPGFEVRELQFMQ